MQVKLELKIVLSLLVIVNEASILFDLTQHVNELAEAEGEDEEGEESRGRHEHNVDPEKAAQIVQLLLTVDSLVFIFVNALDAVLRIDSERVESENGHVKDKVEEKL